MREVHRILCPTELERPAYTPLRYAFFVAERFHASLDVIHARSSPMKAPRMRFAYSESRIAQLITDQSVRKRLDDVVRAIITAVPGRAAAHIVDGQPLAAVLGSVRRFESDLIVVGSRVDAKPRRLLVANFAEQVAYTVACAVLSVPEGNSDCALRVRRILVPVDFSSSTAAAIDGAAVFARRFDAPVELLHVRGSSASHAEDEISDSHAEDEISRLPRLGRAKAQLEELQDQLRTAGVAVACATLVDGAPFERILERIRVNECDLVVMSTDSCRKTVGVICPGVLASVRRCAPVPVLSLRGPHFEPAFLNWDMQSENAAHERALSEALERDASPEAALRKKSFRTRACS